MSTPASTLRYADRYRVLRRVGAGGMATVFLAEDERLGRQVALKRLHADSPEDMARRFDREARLGASLNHPNLVTVFDTVVDPEGVLIVMEYVDGPSLGAALKGGALERDRALNMIREIAAALDQVHGQEIVHRDVKPANILLAEQGQAKLADLGIARAAEAATHITRTGTVLGTPSYMAPEQLEGREVGPAVDVYALATVAFEALSGRKARTGGSPLEIAHQIATQSAPDLREAWAEAPEGASQVLCEGMAFDPAKRPDSAGELAQRLEGELGGGRASTPASRRVGRRTAAAAGGAAAVGGAAGAAESGAGAASPPESEAGAAESGAGAASPPESEAGADEGAPVAPAPEAADAAREEWAGVDEATVERPGLEGPAAPADEGAGVTGADDRPAAATPEPEAEVGEAGELPERDDGVDAPERASGGPEVATAPEHQDADDAFAPFAEAGPPAPRGDEAERSDHAFSGNREEALPSGDGLGEAVREDGSGPPDSDPDPVASPADSGGEAASEDVPVPEGAPARAVTRPAQAQPASAGGRRPAWLVPLALLLVVGAVAVALVIALGGDGGTSARQGEPQTPGAGQNGSDRAADGAGAATGASGDPTKTVTSFYERAAAGDYQGAWALAGPGFRSQLGSFESFRGGVDTLESIEFRQAETTEQQGDSAEVALRTVATHSDGVDRCEGSLTVNRDGANGWLIDRANISCPDSTRG